MADRNPEQDSLIKEIDEELRQEKYAELWKKYGNYVIAAAVVLVVAVGGYQGWKSYDLNKRSRASADFASALRAIDAGKPDDAKLLLDTLIKGSGGYADLARIDKAALLGKTGDKAAASKALFAIADDSGVDGILRDLAAVLGVLQGLDSGDPKALLKRLEPLTASGGAWRHSAMELTALLARRTGDTGRARALYKKLADDATAPSGIRARAAEMTAILGG